MRILLRLIFLICLLVPITANGQKHIYMPSLGVGVIDAPPPKEPCGFTLVCGGGYPTVSLQLIIVDPSRQLGPDLGYIHRASYSPFTGYGFGLASFGRYHFVGVSVGPDLTIPGFLYDTDGQHPDGWRVGFHGQAGAFIMPMKFLGLGIFLYGKPALHGKPAGWGFTYELMVRVG